MAPTRKKKREPLPELSSPNFSGDLNRYFSGQTGPCNYFQPPSDPLVVPRCKPPEAIGLNDFAVQQRLVPDYLGPGTPYRGILAYHSLGSGKTLLCINLIGKYLREEPDRIIVMTVKPSLKQNFLTELGKVDSQTLFGVGNLTEEERASRISSQLDLISYEELANRLKGETAWDRAVNSKKGASDRGGGGGYGSLSFGTRRADSEASPLLNNTLVIIDEAHNLVTPEDAKYPPVNDANVLMESLKRATDIRILLMTATPMRNEPFEIGLLLNMMRHRDDPLRFPEVYGRSVRMGSVEVRIVDKPATRDAFNKAYLGESGVMNQDDFVARAKGMVSYFFNENDLSQFPKKIFVEPVLVPMSASQQDKMLLKMAEEARLMMQKNKPVSCRSSPNLCASVRAVSNTTSIRRNEISPKIAEVVKTIEAAAPLGKQFAYSFFDAAGVNQVMRALVNKGWVHIDLDMMRATFHNFRSADIRQRDFPPRAGVETLLKSQFPLRKAFVVLGSEDSDAEYKKKLTLEFFNMVSNDHGERINLFIANKNYSEGISLKSVRTLHVVDPPTSNALYRQIVGRGARFCSHNRLRFPMEWEVRVYSYFSVFNDPSRKENAASQNCTQHDVNAEACEKNEWCSYNRSAERCDLLPIDLAINKMAKQLALSNDFFENLLQMAAVDCQLLQNLNKITGTCAFAESPGTVKTSCEGAGEQAACLLKASVCQWKKGWVMGGTCVPRSTRESCRDKEDSEHCVEDPRCRWGINRSFSNVNIHPECFNRYLPGMEIPFTFALGDRVFRFRVLRKTDVKASVQELLDRLEKHGGTRPVIQNVLLELLQLVKLGVNDLRMQWEHLRTSLEKHQTNHPELWKDKIVRDVLFSLVDEYRWQTREGKSRHRVLDLDLENERVSLPPARDFLEYQLHLRTGGRDVFFDSLEDPMASLFCEGASLVNQVTKMITINGVKIAIQFFLSHNSVRRVRLFYLVVPGKTGARDTEGQLGIVDEPNEEACKKLWEEDPNLVYPVATGSSQLMACSARWEKNKFSVPKEWATKKNCPSGDDRNEECTSDRECWTRVAARCRERYGRNPARCTRKPLSFWKRTCEESTTPAV